LCHRELAGLVGSTNTNVISGGTNTDADRVNWKNEFLIRWYRHYIIQRRARAVAAENESLMRQRWRIPDWHMGGYGGWRSYGDDDHDPWGAPIFRPPVPLRPNGLMPLWL
jgi:hypothetical protein